LEFGFVSVAAGVDSIKFICRFLLVFSLYMAVGIAYRVTALGVSGLEVIFSSVLPNDAEI
jgi:hypothetical protein